MSRFVESPTDFAAECKCRGGRCTIARENFLFLDDGNELAAISRLQDRCGYVVVMPGAAATGQALLYHTSCRRMTDVVGQIFEADLGAPSSLPRTSPEMTLGTLYRRSLNLSYDRCRTKVNTFDLQRTAEPHSNP
jgi:hypothetical protein